MDFITFDQEKYDRFKNAYAKALVRKRQSFIFDGNEFLTDYAKYALEYMKPKFERGDDDASSGV